MVTGEERYREAVRRVLRNLPRYRGHDWESGSHDGYADAIESALYLVNREPVPEALDWIETETARLIAFQQEDGTIERWYGDGNWARTLLLYAMMKTQGCFLDGWQEGVRLGAVRDGDRLFVSLEAPAGWKGRLRFDHARHRRDLNFARNYVRLNEWPEWYTVDENTLYRLTDAAGKEIVRLGSELEDGIEVAGAGRWIVEPGRAKAAGRLNAGSSSRSGLTVESTKCRIYRGRSCRQYRSPPTSRRRPRSVWSVSCGERARLAGASSRTHCSSTCRPWRSCRPRPSCPLASS